MEFILYALVTALGLLILLFKLGIRRVAYFDVLIDVFFTVSLVFVLDGSFAGLMTAAFAGVFFSLSLWLAKQYFGTERPVLTWRYPFVRWIDAA